MEGRTSLLNQRRTVDSMKKIFTKDLFILWLAIAALTCAAINLNASLNLLAEKGQE